MTTILIPATETIHEGQELITYSNVLKEGEICEVARSYKGITGNSIATAEVIMNMKNDPDAPISRRTATTKDTAWRFLWKIKIVRIK